MLNEKKKTLNFLTVRSKIECLLEIAICKNKKYLSKSSENIYEGLRVSFKN